jgi:hypothetical protein
MRFIYLFTLAEEIWVLIYSFSYGYVCTQEISDWVTSMVILKLNRSTLYVGGSQKVS